MYEDKLSREERIRLEAVAQANNIITANNMGGSRGRFINASDVIDMAGQIAAYITGSEPR